MNSLEKKKWRNRRGLRITPAVKKAGAVLIIVFLLAAPMVFARAGGAGGSSSSSSGGGDGIGFLIYLIIRVIPFPYNVIIIGGGFVVYGVTQKKRNQTQNSAYLKQSFQAPAKVPGMPGFLKRYPSFSLQQFEKKVITAFTAIQKAWADQDIARARVYISDGIYQRFTTQVVLMKELQQTNTLNNIQIRQIWPDRVEEDNTFDVIHVGIRALVNDRFVSKLDPRLNSGGEEEFVEYWTFIRKKSVKKGDLYQSTSCPNCGGELPANTGDVAKCEYCGTLLNSGDYDWVLSEITQAADYAKSPKGNNKISRFMKKIQNIAEVHNDFSIQIAEDKASNGFLQIKTAIALKEPAKTRRFVTDNLFAKIQAEVKALEHPIVYNRFFINDVTLCGAETGSDIHRLHAAVTYSFQRIRLLPGLKVEIMDAVPRRTAEYMILEKSAKPQDSKGPLYASCCPSCGAAVENAEALECSYCGNPYNLNTREWITADLLSGEEYRAYQADIDSAGDSVLLNPDVIDSLYGIKDYALVNMFVVMAADGRMDQNERLFAQQVVKSFGFKSDRIEPLFNDALQGRLSIRMPDSAKQQVKIYRLMERAAKVDNDYSAEEQKLLEAVRHHYNITL